MEPISQCSYDYSGKTSGVSPSPFCDFFLQVMHASERVELTSRSSVLIDGSGGRDAFFMYNARQ